MFSKTEELLEKVSKKVKNPFLLGFFAVILSPLILIYSIIHVFSLLFLSPYHSFACYAAQHANGIYAGSYVQHLKYKRKIRIYSCGTIVLLIIISVIITNFLVNGIIDNQWFWKDCV